MDETETHFQKFIKQRKNCCIYHSLDYLVIYSDLNSCDTETMKFCDKSILIKVSNFCEPITSSKS